jgi:hypothetical protein
VEEATRGWVMSDGGFSYSNGDIYGVFATGNMYIDGSIYVKESTTNKTFTPNKATYVDLGKTGIFSYIEKTPGSPRPSPAAGKIRIGKVVTDSTKITGFTPTARMTSVKDSSGYAKNGVVTGTGTAKAPMGFARRFLGGSDNITITGLNMNYSAFTISFWYKSTGLGGVIMSWSDSNRDIQDIAGTGCIITMDGGNTSIDAYYPESYVGKWTNVLFTYNGYSGYLYINGRLYSNVAMSKATYTNSTFIIGNDFMGNGYEGDIANIIFRNVYTPRIEAVKLYNQNAKRFGRGKLL